MGRNRANSRLCFEIGRGKWIVVFEKAHILIFLSQICGQKPKIFPCGAYYPKNEQSPYVLAGETGTFVGFFIRKIIIFIRKILRIIFIFFTSKNFRAKRKKKSYAWWCYLRALIKLGMKSQEWWTQRM